MKLATLTLPAWMASPLINGDTSALSLNADGGAEDEAKLERLEAWLAWHGYGSALSCSDGEDFRNRPSFDSVNTYGETLGGDFLEFTFPVDSAFLPRKGTLEAYLLPLLQAYPIGTEFAVIALELTHDGQGWYVNTPFMIGTACDIAETLEHTRGRWETFKANYCSKARVSAIEDTSCESDGPLMLDCEGLPFLEIRPVSND